MPLCAESMSRLTDELLHRCMNASAVGVLRKRSEAQLLDAAVFPIKPPICRKAISVGTTSPFSCPYSALFRITRLSSNRLCRRLGYTEDQL